MFELFQSICRIDFNRPETWEGRIFLTFDIDWATDEVLSDTIDLVEAAQVCATWFVTHDTPVLARLRDNPAFCFLEDKKLVIWDAALPEGDDENYLAIPGQVTAIGKGFAEIATGAGKLRISQVEVDDRPGRPDQYITSLRERLS